VQGYRVIFTVTFNLKTLDRSCLILIVLVTLTGGYLSFSYRIKDQKRAERETELAARRSMELEMADKNLSRLEKALDTRREDIKTINDQISGTADIGSFLKQLNALTEENGIGMTSIRPMPSLKGEYYTRIPVQLICQGSFKSIFTLLRALEAMEKNLLIEKLAISRPDNQQECGLELTASILKYDKGTDPLGGAEQWPGKTATR
jgi:Tfp pilus assembly protein PilO